MLNLKLSFLIVFISFITITSCKQDTKVEKLPINKEMDIKDSKEFKEYYSIFFTLSDKNTKTDLPYVNKFMTDNELLPVNNICDLVDNKIVKGDKLVYNHWVKRCNFQKSRSALMEKFNIDGDSIKYLIEEAVNDM